MPAGRRRFLGSFHEPEIRSQLLVGDEDGEDAGEPLGLGRLHGGDATVDCVPEAHILEGGFQEPVADGPEDPGIVRRTDGDGVILARRRRPIDEHCLDLRHASLLERERRRQNLTGGRLAREPRQSAAELLVKSNVGRETLADAPKRLGGRETSLAKPHVLGLVGWEAPRPKGIECLAQDAWCGSVERETDEVAGRLDRQPARTRPLDLGHHEDVIGGIGESAPDVTDPARSVEVRHQCPLPHEPPPSETLCLLASQLTAARK